MQGHISLDDVIASAEANNGIVLEYDAKNANDLRTKNPKSTYDVAYIPIVFKHVSGKKISPVDIVFKEQIISSSATQPPSNDGTIPSCLQIVFKRLKRDDIACGDYVPKTMDSPELQEKEDARVNKAIDKYLANNNKFITALEILYKSYMHMCEHIRENVESFSFRVNKDKNQKVINICVFKQTTRLDRATNKDILLEPPLYRLKLPVYKTTGEVGVFRNNTMKRIVNDARKMNAKNNYTPVIAKVNVNGKSKHLDYKNTREFITYNSLIGGIIRFDAISSSKAGLSLQNAFYELYVFRHKTKFARQVMTRDDIIEMRGDIEEDDDDDDVEINDEAESEFIGENPDGNEEDGNPDIEPIDESDEEEKPKPKRKQTTVKTGKRN